MINFDALVLAPAMGVFAKPVTVTPIRSQPTAAPYPARGVWEIANVAIVTEDGGQFSNRTIKLGVRMSEFTVLPVQGDWITTKVQHLPLAYTDRLSLDPNSTMNFVIDDQSPDGQGGCSLTLKRVTS
jgi:hypothetical protein